MWWIGSFNVKKIMKVWTWPEESLDKSRILCPARYLNRIHRTYAVLSRFPYDESAEWKEMSNFCVQFKLRHVKTDSFYWILPTTQCVWCNSHASCRRSHYCNTRGEITPRPSPLFILYLLMNLVQFSSIIYVPLPARIQRMAVCCSC